MAEKRTPPERIYLQNYGDPDFEATWCEDRIEDDDVEYVRADLPRKSVESDADTPCCHEGCGCCRAWTRRSTEPVASERDALDEISSREHADSCGLVKSDGSAACDCHVSIARRALRRTPDGEGA